MYTLAQRDIPAAGDNEMHGNIIFRPWVAARAEGRDRLAILLFLMQVSLVFWPAAVRIAQRLGLEGQKERQKQGLLNELVAINAPIRPRQQLQICEFRLEEAS
jgi:hypothetical protein